MIYGKLVAGFIGLLTGGIYGLILGLILGHIFDRALGTTLQFGSPANIVRIQQSFFETTFLLLGFLAKADGRISRQEIDLTENLFNQMALSADQRARAKDLFRRGAEPDFVLEPVVTDFLDVCGAQKQLQQTLLLFLISMALADHSLETAEREALGRVAALLGFGAAQLDQLLRMAQAQGQFHGRQGGSVTPSASTLDQAYAALGVNADVNDKDLKRAYRKLMSEHHPDKLIARGVPDDMLKLATEKAQEIQGAYAMICKARGI